MSAPHTHAQPTPTSCFGWGFSFLEKNAELFIGFFLSSDQAEFPFMYTPGERLEYDPVPPVQWVPPDPDPEPYIPPITHIPERPCYVCSDKTKAPGTVAICWDCRRHLRPKRYKR